MPKNSYSDNINQMKVMLAGIKNNAEALAKRGVDSAFVSQFEETYVKSQTLDNEQEKLKADLKVKTAELAEAMRAGLTMYAEAKKLVKITIPQEQWREFGIEDKR